jgi:hypothetical protein
MFSDKTVFKPETGVHWFNLKPENPVGITIQCAHTEEIALRQAHWPVSVSLSRKPL